MSLSKDEVLMELARYGSTGEMANYFGVSKSTVRKVLNDLMGISRGLVTLTNKDNLEKYLGKYKSIRLSTRMLNLHYSTSLSENDVRKAAKDLGVDLGSLLDWSLSEHSNGKGRRAEMDFAKLRGDAILLDLNKTDPQAKYDFDDREMGKVNVKSSRRWKLKASTRKDDPFYWKFSMNGWSNCTHFACLAYDEDMKELLGVCILYPSKRLDTTSSTFVLKESDLKPPSWLSNLMQDLPPLSETLTTT